MSAVQPSDKEVFLINSVQDVILYYIYVSFRTSSRSYRAQAFQNWQLPLHTCLSFKASRSVVDANNVQYEQAISLRGPKTYEYTVANTSFEKQPAGLYPQHGSYDPG